MKRGADYASFACKSSFFNASGAHGGPATGEPIHRENVAETVHPLFKMTSV
jgi:hypothetical protein